MSRIHSEWGLLSNLEHFVRSRGAGDMGACIVLAVLGWLLRRSHQNYTQSCMISSMHPGGLTDACDGQHRCGEDVHEQCPPFPKLCHVYYTLILHNQNICSAVNPSLL